MVLCLNGDENCGRKTDMKRIQYNLWLMGALIVVSAISILVIEVERLRMVKNFIRMVLPFLTGRGVLISNLFLGIGASAFVSFVAGVIDFALERRKISDSLLDAYKLLKKEILPYLGKETAKQACQHYEYNGVMNKCRKLAEENNHLLRKKKKDANYYIVLLITILDIYYLNIKTLVMRLEMECNNIGLYDKLIASDTRCLKDLDRSFAENIREWKDMNFSEEIYKKYTDQHDRLVKNLNENIRKSKDKRKQCRKNGAEIIGQIKCSIKAMETDEDIARCQRFILMHTGDI